MTLPRPAVLITGTSTGIGFDAARFLIHRGFRVFGSLRREEDGRRVRQELGDHFFPLLFDVTDREKIQNAVQLVSEELAGATLAGLINNAGIAVAGPLEYLDLDQLRQQFEINTFGVVAVTQAFLPLLSQPGGRIINISSVSGRIAYPFFGPYAGSKFALEAISDSWRRELLLRGIDVIVVQPGSVKTPIWDKAADFNMSSHYQETVYRDAVQELGRVVERSAAGGMPVEKVSLTIYQVLTARRPRARYALPNRPISGWWAPRLLPARWLDRILARVMKLQRKKN